MVYSKLAMTLILLRLSLAAATALLVFIGRMLSMYGRKVEE